MQAREGMLPNRRLARRTPISAGDWPTVFYSLKFASWTPKPSGLAKQLIGRWSWASSTMALMYTFAANGHYDDGATELFVQTLAADHSGGPSRA